PRVALGIAEDDLPAHRDDVRPLFVLAHQPRDPKSRNDGVGIGARDDVPTCDRKSARERSTVAAPRLADDANRVGTRHGGSGVGARVVYDNDLDLTPIVLKAKRFDARREEGFLVIGGY